MGRRLIPAHAGKTSARPSTASSGRAHPRSRGENVLDLPLLTGGARLIPAHAGKTQPTERPSHEPWAHPRSRGENAASASASHRVAGSSPLTRGKRGHEPPRRRCPGLIPAHAGKTRVRRTGQFPVPAHPRSRGENGGRAVRGCGAGGSSPLTRGKPEAKRRELTRFRLIPAHAGKTGAPPSTASPGGAHPRSRGENVGCELDERYIPGSSPLTRGKRVSHEHVQIRRGLIPAHAGKTVVVM